MPGVQAPPNTADQVEEFLKKGLTSFMRGGAYDASIVVESGAIGDDIAAGAGAVAVAGAGTGGTELAAAAAGLSGIIILILFLFIVMSVRLLRWLEEVIVWVPGHIPWVGGSIQDWVRRFFSVIDPLENAVAGAAAKAAIETINGYQAMFFGFMHFFGLVPASSASPSGNVTGDLHTIQHEITQLNNSVQRINSVIGTLNYVTQNRHLVTGVPQNVWDQLHQVQAEQQKLTQGLAYTQGQLNAVDSRLTSMEHQLHTLSQGLYDVRAVSVGWQDIAQSVQQLETTTTHFIDTTTADISQLHRHVVRLEPLGVLLGAGLVGLKTLRQLEDTPCMCPKLPNIPNLLPDRLAVYEFITNG